MSSEYGRKSAADMRAAQKDMLAKAEAVQPTVAVMEPNWRAIIASQREQVDTLGDIMETMETLTTKEELVEYMNRQLQALTEHSNQTIQIMEEYQETMMNSAENVEQKCHQAATSMEKQAGSVSEKFSQALTDQTTLMKKLTKRCFRIAMIPGLILLLLELVPRIWQLIFGS